MKGFDFFISKTSNDSYDKFESLAGFMLPEYFKLFSSLYEVGTDQILSPKYLDPKFGSVSDCGLLVFKLTENEEYGFDGFFNEEELIDDWENYSSVEAEFSEFDLLRIATLGVGGGLFLGVKEDKKDKIYNFWTAAGICTIGN